LVQGVTKDMSRIWQGHAMPALGEGPVCDYCEVRGLCRKDHWAADADQLMDQEGA
jgi:ATP-dependent helicase/nuclease subunit B